MSRTWFRYGLWAATLVVVAWATALMSALVGGKGIDKVRVPVDGTVPGGRRPVNLGIFPDKAGPA